jgi:hypothetical protein
MRFNSLKGILPVLAILAACLCLGILPSIGTAQEITAAITGTVTDQSGAPVAGAKVIATDTQRGTEYPTTTNGDGAYSLPRVPSSTYTVRVENQGFATSQQSNVALQLNQVARLDFQLQLGNVQQSIEVSSAAPLLQTENTQLGSVIDARTNTQIPLATRNYVQLTLLTAGAVTVNPQGFKNAQTTFNSSRPYINGNREQTNNFIMDGIDNNQISDNLVAYAPSVDAIQEFNQITQNPSAEFGNFLGGITSVSIKSGTNEFHGNVFEFFRNDKLNANEWNNNWQNKPKNLLRWNMFGASLGGPIKKNKLFFFADYQGSRYDQPGTNTPFTVLTAQERAGDFSQYLNPALVNKTVQLKDPKTGIPYAGNIIPQAQLSSVALNMVSSSLYTAALNNGILTQNASNPTRTQVNSDQGDIKVDYNMSEKDRIFGRYTRSNVDNPTIRAIPLSYNSYGRYPIQNAALDYTRTISPSLVNNFRVGLNYNIGENGTSASDLGDLPSQFGLPGAPSTIFPAQVFTGGFASTIGSANVAQSFHDAVIQYEDTVIWTVSQHTMHFGFQGWRYRINNFYSGNNGTAGQFLYNGQFSGIPEADFMLGLPNEVGSGPHTGTVGQRANVFSGFFEDTWRATPRLTLNYGVRYELHTPWIEVYNRMVNFTPFGGQPQYPGQPNIYNNNRALYNQYNGVYNFQPRVGIAYRATDKTVVRAAYSMSSFMEGTGTNLRLTINPPFSTETDVQYNSLPYPASTLDQGFVPLTSPTDIYKGVNLRLWDPNVRPAVSNQWNLSVQQQFDNSTTLQVAYVGQKNNHLVVAQPYNQNLLLPNGTVQRSPYLSGNPALQSSIGNISATETNGNQTYNALQITLQRRLAQGLQGSFAYTWSRCMSDSIGFYGAGTSQAAGQGAYAQNLYDRKSQWGPCFYDIKHNISSYISYDLPFGRGRMFGSNMNGFFNAIAGGWQLNALIAWHGGFPITINANDRSGTNSRGSRANCLATPTIYGERNSPQGGYQWFDPTAFAQPVSGFGNCGVGTVRGPGLATADLSVSKRFAVTEHQNLELRGEFINAFNHPILQAFNRSAGAAVTNGVAGTNPTLGLLQTSQGARNIQIGLKYNF